MTEPEKGGRDEEGEDELERLAAETDGPPEQAVLRGARARA